MGGGPPEEEIVEESAIAFITRIKGDELISDEGFAFKYEHMTCREAIRGVDFT